MKRSSLPGRHLLLCAALLVPTSLTAADGGPIHAEFQEPTADRWMYAFNSMPGTRPAAPVFSTFTESEESDTRVGQFLMGWDTTSRVPSGRPPQRYLIRSVRLTLTTLRDQSFVNDSTADAFETALPAGDPRAWADADAGRPIELYGAGFRDGFTADTFHEDSPFGSNQTGARNAFAAGFNPARELVDVSNNVGKTREPFLPFASRPFAIGVITNVPAGEPVPAGSPVTFRLELGDPDVRGYLQNALSTGRLWLAATWLGRSAGQTGGFTYPDFATRDNLLDPGPQLELDVVVIGDEDTDADGLPDDWERACLHGLTETGEGDADGDGMTNANEWALGSDPDDRASRVVVQDLRRESNGTVRLNLEDAGPGPLVIETSTDLRQWSPVPGRMEFLQPVVGHWTSEEPVDPASAFFRCRRAETSNR